MSHGKVVKCEFMVGRVVLSEAGLEVIFLVGVLSSLPVLFGVRLLLLSLEATKAFKLISSLLFWRYAHTIHICMKLHTSGTGQI